MVPWRAAARELPGVNAALLYKDVKAVVSLLVLEVTIGLDKGKRKRNAP